MGKIEKYFYWFCFFLAIYITIGFKLVPNVIKDQLVKNLDENLTLKTTVEKVEFNPFTLNTKIHNFKLGDIKDPTISFGQFQLDFGLLQSIFELHVNIESVSLKKPIINIIENKDGSFNLTKILKPTETKEEKKEDTTSSGIKFLVSKVLLENANINFTKIKEGKPYKLAINDINYALHDLGTYKNILSSNDFNLKINNDAKVSIVGAFNLQPFKMYGKAYISQLKLKELLDYKKEILNFDLDKNAQFDLALDYNIDTNKEFDLKISTNKLEFKNINLKQNKKDILKLEKLVVKTLNLDLAKQKINLQTLNLTKPFINMIQNKEGLNLANLTKLEKEQKVKAKVEKRIKKREENPEEIKPWNINLSDINLNKANVIFNDKINKTIAKNKNFNVKVSNVNLNGSNINLKSLKVVNPNLSFVDNKNLMTLNSSNLVTTINKLKIKNNNINITDVKVIKDKLTLNDKKSAFKITTNKSKVNLDSLNIKDGKISIKTVKLLAPYLNINNKKSRLDITTRNTNLSVNNIGLNKGITTISKISLKNPKLIFKDRKSKLDINAKNTDILASKLKIKGNKTVIAKVSLKNPTLNIKDNINKTNIDIKKINLALNTLVSNNGNLSIKNIKLTKPTISLKDKKSNIELDTKNLTVNINRFTQNKYGLKISSLRVHEPDLSFYNTKDKTQIYAKNLDLSVSNITNNKKGLKVGKANLNKPILSVILPKKEKVENEIKKEVVKKTTTNDKKPKSKLAIGPVNIKDAILNFEDKNLPIPFKTTISKLNGKISEINTINTDTTKLEVNGIVDEYGTTKITGIVDPNNIKILTDINMLFKNINMKNFTPYTDKFVGRQLDSGKLGLDLKYNIQKSDLDAKNNIVITKIKFGKKVESPDAVSLPLDLAIALLEDTSGVIDLNIPVSGNLDDPKFSIAPIVWKAFTNLIMKAITAPFSLLGAMFGFDENEIKSVNFEFAQSDIKPAQKETLDKISQILVKRPNLALKLTASYDKNKDLKAMKRVKYEKLLENELPDKQSKTYEKKHLALMEELYSDYDKKVIDLRKKHSSKKKLNIKSYKQELEEFLVSQQKVTKVHLETMAKDRITNIKNYLITEKKINANQIKLNNKIETVTQSKKTSNINLKIDKSK